MRRATTLSAVYAILERCAIDGARCPENDTHGIPHGYLPQMARRGWIEIRVFARNYRQVVLLKGPHKGKTTASDPSGLSPWMIVNRFGRRTNTASNA